MEQETSHGPRPPQVGECLSVGWERLQDQMGVLVLIMAVYLIVIFLGGGIGAGLGGIVLYGPMTLGLFYVHRKAYRGEKVQIEDLFFGFKKFLPAFLNGLLYTIAWGVGFMFCIVPAYFVMGCLAYWPLVLEDGREEGIEALIGSKDLTQPFILQSTLTVFVLTLIGFSGLLFCCVGVLLTAPIATMGIIHAYETMKGND